PAVPAEHQRRPLRVQPAVFAVRHQRRFLLSAIAVLDVIGERRLRPAPARPQGAPRAPMLCYACARSTRSAPANAKAAPSARRLDMGSARNTRASTMVNTLLS